MKFHTSLIAFSICSASMFFSCDDDTASIGSTIMPVQDSLTTFFETFPIKTHSVLTGPVVANTSNCFIGSIVDPETGAVTTSSFLAQFHLQEDYTLPSKELIIKNAEGQIVADSCVVRIFHDKFYGDSLTTMKLTLTDLRLDNIMEEGTTYYTDINPQDYVNPTPKVSKTITYSVLDQNLSESATSLSSGNYRSIPVHLGAEYGTYILRNFYDHPEYFKNSYTFIHNVCPGFYVEHTGGIGTIINADVSALDVYFRYQENDTTVTKAWMRLAATQEVIQNTRYNHDFPQEMLEDDNDFTYIKSPAGIHTEVIIPIDQIANGKHYNDTLNSARFTLRRYVAQSQKDFSLTPPTHLLLVRKGHADEFFAERKLPDNKTTFLCSYSNSTNAYTFTNIAPLITYIRDERNAAAGITESDDAATREAKWQALEEKDPYWYSRKGEDDPREDGDWKRLQLIPVIADYSTTSSNSMSYYYSSSSSSTLVGIRNDYNLRSVKLEGSKNGEVKLNVIYSRFEK